MSGGNLERFVRGVRGRLGMARVVEGMGAGVLVGCGVALPVVGVGVWRGEAVVGIGMGAMVLGAVCGAVAGGRRWPSELEVARVADERLKWAELVSTAVGLGGREDAWAGCVRAVAEARCGRASAGDVVVRRWTGRAWGGVGLAGAMVITVALFGGNAGRGGAGVVTDASVREGMTGRTDEGAERGVAGMGVAGEARRAAGESAGAGRGFVSGERDGEANGTGAGRGAPGAGAGGSGAGFARGNHGDVREGARGVRGVKGGTGGGSETGGGAGAGAAGVGGADTVASGVGEAGAVRARRWEGEAWRAAAAEAGRAVDGGAVPGAYRDLVRDYFSPGDGGGAGR